MRSCADGSAGANQQINPLDCSSCLFPGWQLPVRPNVVARVSTRKPLQIILVLRLSFPEWAGLCYLSDYLAGPKTRSLNIGDSFLRNAPLFVVGIENSRTVAHPAIIALAVGRSGIVNLEEILKQLPVA